MAVYFRLHHAFADGAAALAAFGALLDMTPNAPTPVAPDWRPMPIPTDIDLLRDNLRRRGQELGRGWAGVTHPRRTIRSARETWPAWREVLAEEPAPRTSLNRPVRASYQVQPDSLRNFGAAVFATSSVPTTLMVWWAAGFTAVTLIFAVRSFSTRQL